MKFSHWVGILLRKYGQIAEKCMFCCFEAGICGLTKIDLAYPIENSATILKMILQFSQNLFFMELWRHNDVIFAHFRHFKGINNIFHLFNPITIWYGDENHSLSYEKFNGEHDSAIHFITNCFFMELWRHITSPMA